MKLVAINGSPHGMKGNTGKLLANLLAETQAAGVEITTFSLGETDIRPCRGCEACHRTGKCPIRDDFDKLKDVLQAADTIVLASPNYIFSVSAQLKAFCDRCSGVLHCQAWEGKYGAAVVTSGGPGADEVEGYLLRFLQATGCWTVGSVGAEAFRLVAEDTRKVCFKAASDLGRQLVASVQTKRSFPEQAARRAAFAERMKQLITARRKQWPYEYQQWQARGLV